MPPKNKKRPVTSPASPKNKKKKKTPQPPHSPPALMRRSSRTEPGPSNISNALQEAGKIPEPPAIQAPSQFRTWEVTEATALDDLCMIVQASLAATHGDQARSPSPMNIETEAEVLEHVDNPHQADNDAPLFFTDSSCSPSPVSQKDNEPLDEAFLYIGLYIRHNKRMVLGELVPTPMSVYEEWGSTTPAITYVMYIYPELLTVSLLNLPLSQAGVIDSVVLVAGESSSMTEPELAEDPLVTSTPPPSAPATRLEDSWLTGLLAQQIGSAIEEYQIRKQSKRYGTAYMALMQDALLTKAENTMFAAGRQAETFDYNGIQREVTVIDVHVALLGPQSTWKNHRSLIRKAHRAHQALQLVHSHAPNTLSAEDLTWLEELNAFFATMPLGPAITYPDISCMEYRAATLNLARLERKSGEVLDKYHQGRGN
ncbi:uncharacterized protein EV420DRAFT_1476501 [Desarmillaria tabescens]|uniref:Uncharacterized protein n=1 Tax=Armillaria tabescens TaxID=1929756 RepID=A0AA39NDV7_ARMTA|nr:uncharacterized protein EV420DRAFT_1476501 [Desarmillaria tabescens]KAK0463848.1 hypothetical protein EV420DRAFT_1476501 [Desarmillaria tabescens]